MAPATKSSGRHVALLVIRLSVAVRRWPCTGGCPQADRAARLAWETMAVDRDATAMHFQ